MGVWSWVIWYPLGKIRIEIILAGEQIMLTDLTMRGQTHRVMASSAVRLLNTGKVPGCPRSLH